MSNTFGSNFRVSTWGESHGNAIGVMIDGCPPMLPINESDIQKEVNPIFLSAGYRVWKKRFELKFN